MPARTGDLIAGLVGARAGEVLAGDSTTVNLYKLCAAALDARPGPLVIERASFPTDRYVLEGLAAQRGARAAARRRRGDRARRRRSGRPLARRLPDRRDRRHAGARRSARGRRARGSSGTSAIRRARCPWSCAPAAPSWPSAAPTSTSTPGRERPAFLYVASELQPAAPLADLGLVRPARPVRDGARLRPGRRHRPLPRRHADDRSPSARSRRRARSPPRRASSALYEKATAQCELIVALHDAWLAPLGFELGSPRDPAPPRLARLAPPPGGVADLPRADRARQRDPGLPRAGLDPARRRPALHALRRRLRRARPPARPGRARRAAPGRRQERSRVT